MLNNIATVYKATGKTENAMAYLWDALLIMREANDREGEARVLNTIGAVYDDLGDASKALECYEQALPIMRQANDKEGEASVLNNMGAVYDDSGDTDKAMVCYEQALPIMREVGNKKGEATTLNNIGKVSSILGEKDKSLIYYKKALLIAREVDDISTEAGICLNIGMIYDSLGDLDKAIEYLERCVLLDEQVQHPDLESDRRALMALKRKRGGGGNPPPETPLSAEEQYKALIKRLTEIYQALGEAGLRQMLTENNVPSAQIEEILIAVMAQVGENADDTPATLPFETIREWVSNTYAVKTNLPEQLEAWREQLEGAKSRMAGMGDEWGNEVQFVEALLAVLRDETPVLPSDHPYHEPIQALLEGLKG
jgi:tetratricopeptide (TPR) repeat protein